jgi:hypothetical protein
MSALRETLQVSAGKGSVAAATAREGEGKMRAARHAIQPHKARARRNKTAAAGMFLLGRGSRMIPDCRAPPGADPREGIASRRKIDARHASAVCSGDPARAISAMPK